MKRVFVLGLDGVSPLIWQRLVDAGWLPKLSKIIKATLPLRSTIPPYTPAAWTSIATGLNPGRHGILDFWQRDANHTLFTGLVKRKLVSNGIRQAFWEVADQQGFRVGVYNYPLSYPPRPVTGFWSSGMTTPVNVNDYAIPDKLVKALSGFYPDLDLFMTGSDTAKPVKSDDILLQQIIRLLDNHIQCGISALRAFKDEIDLYVFVVTATDRFLHYFYNNLPGMVKNASENPNSLARQFWLSLDSGVSEWIDLANPDTVLIASDHGFTASPTHAFNAYRWLQNNGWLKTKLGLNPKVALRQIASMSPGLKRLVRSRLPASLENMFKRETDDQMVSAVNPAKSRVIAETLYGSYLGLTINLRGREETGIVKTGEMAKLCDEVMSNALSLRNDAGLPIMRSVHRATDVWHGEFVGRFPDVVLELNPEYGSATGTWDPRLTYTVQTTRQGEHDITGLLASSQPWQPNRTDMEDHQTSVWDVAAIALYMLGAKVPVYMDGRVPDWIRTDPVRMSSTSLPTPESVEFSNDDSEIIQKRLRSLGYME